MKLPMASSLHNLPSLVSFLGNAQRIVFLTGAGMSTESGIADFRSTTGLYAGGVDKSVFDIEVFDRDPAYFYRFARTFLDTIRQARPNAGHFAVAALATEFRKDVCVCTQNIDALHQEAGISAVFPLHGTLQTFHCRKCREPVESRPIWSAVAAGEIPQHGGCGGILKPDIVFFGEPLPQDVYAAAETAVRQADLLIVAGTSLAVYPAAALPACRTDACRLVIINRDSTPLDFQANLVFHESIGSVLQGAVDRLRKT